MQEVTERKKELIGELKKMGVLYIGGREVNETLSLYTLEWANVVEKNKAAKAYGECR